MEFENEFRIIIFDSLRRSYYSRKDRGKYSSRYENISDNVFVRGKKINTRVFNYLIIN